MIDSQKLNQLWEECAGRLMLYARSIGGEAEDAVQEAFVKLAAQQSLPENPLAWLIRVVRNYTADNLRRRCTAERRVALLARSLDWFAPTAADLCIEAAELQIALSSIQVELRECVVLRLWADMSFEEIGSALDVSSSTAHRRYSEAIRILEQRLDGGCHDG